ncbi:trans-sialidase, putative [Trypanosoma cruzi marinkellei]|uniref:Trans-sialidase, putative n=1 Tax=Trypanosoma cruzi marinkellei TaxID=85056 RepID=K2NJU6_TRYCR|nr:trans-sialidase, putative [Trypanosoma cruzi marinkellei]
MHSRVAAVMAPRTHNRRRVIGSSGRRREGRESERQRPNMSRHLFYSPVLLLLLVMMCCNTGGAAEGEANIKWRGVTDNEGKVDALGAPGLLKVGNDVFAVAEAQCKKGGDANIFTGIASQRLTTQTANVPMEVLKEVKKTQVLEKSSSAADKIDVSRPTTVVEGNDIYMLVGKKIWTTATDPEESGADEWWLLLVKGNVTEGSGGEKAIHWKDTTDVPRISIGQHNHSLTGLIGSGGSGVKTNDGKLVFPVEAVKGSNSREEVGKTASLILYTSKDTKRWTLSNGTSADGCSDPSVVEWKDNQLMMMTACDDGRRRVYESGDKGESWTEALGTLSRVWGNKQGGEAKAVGSGFITATIGNGEDNKRKVMLVTLPVYSSKNGEINEKGVLIFG